MARRAGMPWWVQLAIAGGVLLALTDGDGHMAWHWMSPEEIEAEAKRDAGAARRLGMAPVPGTGLTLQQYLEQSRRVIAPEVPWPLILAYIYREWSQRPGEDAQHDITHGATFFEVGWGQIVWGDTGDAPGVGGGDVSTQYRMPGKNWHHTTGGAAARAFYDDATIEDHSRAVWFDPRVQRRGIFSGLEQHHAITRRRFPSLFRNPGSDWDLRAMMFEFSRGEDAELRVDAADLTRLQDLPEDQRWREFSRDVLEQFPHWAKGIQNVDRKLALAKQLGYVPR